METWLNCHNHGIFSLLDGVSKYEQYAKRCKELGSPGVCFTEHGNIAGLIKLYNIAKAYDLNWIPGEEIYLARKTRFDRDEEERTGKTNDELEQRGPYHLTVLARNRIGYHNLIRISSKAYLEGFYGKPRADYDLLSLHSDGLMILSGCLNGPVQKNLLGGKFDEALAAAARLQDMVGKENFYIEMQDHGIEDQHRVKADTLEIARMINAPIVATCDSHYTYREDSVFHDMSLCISTGSLMSDENRFKFANDQFYLKSFEEMAQVFPVEWLYASLDINEKVNVDLNFGELYFPHFDTPKGETVDSYFEKTVWEGVRQRYGSLNEEVVQRVEYEMRVIREMGFQSYFLSVADILEWGRNNGIRTGYGRGSASGSVVAYSMFITHVDPLKYDLLFERFLVEGRKSPPDIDIDIDDRYRDKLIDYVRSKYGSDRVAHIATYSSINTRSAVKDAGRVLGYDFQTVNNLNKLVPPPIFGFNKNLEESLKSPELKREYDTNEDARKILDAAKGLEGLLRQPGMHPGGIVIAPCNVMDLVPVMIKMNKDGTPGPVTTQWDMDDVELAGLPKIDFLGLRNLGVVDICIENIKDSKGIDVDQYAIPLDDPVVYKSLAEGDCVGVFQLEGSGNIRDLTMSMRPETINDIMAVSALYRPGPMGSGAPADYIARKNGKARVQYAHPLLEAILNKTYGLLIYQEQILKAAWTLAGFSVTEADALRKAVGKKQLDKIGTFRAQFVKGCKDKSGIAERISNRLYDQIEEFGAYGFSENHTLAYSVLSYVTAYLKTYYPAEYMAAVLTSVGTEGAPKYLDDCRKHGITVHPPSINKSEASFRVMSESEILFGLSSIKGVGPSIVNAIMSARTAEYSSIQDFMRGCDLNILNKATLEHLIKSGCLDEIIPPQPERLLSHEEKMNMLDIERQELGLYVSDHPLLGISHLLESKVDLSVADLSARSDGDVVTVGGLIVTVNTIQTRRGEKMYKLDVQDLTGSVEVIVFPREAKLQEFKKGEIVLLTGKVQDDGDGEIANNKLIFTGIQRPEIPQYMTGLPILVSCVIAPSNDIIKRMNILIETTPGDSPVYIEYPEGDHFISLRFKKPSSRSIEDDLKLLGMTNHEL